MITLILFILIIFILIFKNIKKSTRDFAQFTCGCLNILFKLIKEEAVEFHFFLFSQIISITSKVIFSREFLSQNN